MIVTSLAADNIGAVGEFANGLNERVAIDPRLSRAKILGRPFHDIRKVNFCGSTETNTPPALDHERTIRLSGR